MAIAGVATAWKGSLSALIKRTIGWVSLAAAAISILIGWITLELSQKIEQDHHVLMATTYLAAAESDLWRLRHALPHFMVSGKDEQAQILAQQDFLVARVEQNLRALEAVAFDDEELQLAVEAHSAYARYRDARPRFF